MVIANKKIEKDNIYEEMVSAGQQVSPAGGALTYSQSTILSQSDSKRFTKQECIKNRLPKKTIRQIKSPKYEELP